MPAFLSDNHNSCCCDEMRCCPPRAISVTVAGWSGVAVGGWVRTDRCLGDLDVGKHTAMYPATGESTYGLDEDGAYDCSSIDTSIWPASVFPQKMPVSDRSGPCAFACGAFVRYASGWIDYDGGGSGTYIGRCSEIPKCCQVPSSGALRYGYSSPAIFGRTSLDDHNGTYVCHRSYVGMRPEMKAVARRTGGRTGKDAVLSFDVYCRRRWGVVAGCNDEIIKELVCNVTDNDAAPEDPNGKWYCIDYRCGPRSEPPLGVITCEQYQCTATSHPGIVLPHLFPYHQSGNQSAKLKLNLEVLEHFVPELYQYQGAKAAKPKSWIVESASVLNAGRGYTVGEYFTVSFDEKWMTTLQDYRGESFYALPAYDWECGIFKLEWQDEDGLEPVKDETGEDAWWPQRLKITEVDESGGIVSLKVLPWTATPEFKAGSCIDQIADRSKKTQFYPSFARVLCHPNSVDIGGSGYAVGDLIDFVPVSTGVVTHKAAKGEVIDVDDDGAILDWEIKGSDIWRYQMSAPDDAVAFATASGYRFAQCPQYASYDPAEDERGAYKWDSKVALCELQWDGVGVPVRSAGFPLPGTIGNWLGMEMMIGGCSLTAMGVNIQRVPCRTSISVSAFPYKYETDAFQSSADPDDPEDMSLRDSLLNKFRPYPECNGGGCQITPVISNGANESLIGGSLSGAVVASPGRYYAFIDKTHIQPVLPLQIGSLKGAKAVAEIYNGSVTAVNVSEIGYGYQSSSPPTVTFSAPPVPTATGVAVVGSDGKVTSVAIEDRGGGYAKSWFVVITFSSAGSEGTTATGIAQTDESGAISSVSISDGGSGYSQSNPPTVTFPTPRDLPVTATGTATVELDGRVRSITVTNAGSGYKEPPTVTISGPTTEGYGAKLKSFSFSTVANFPAVGFSRGEPHEASAMRFAYFPVDGVSLDTENRGTGYKVGDSFVIRPEGGSPYTDAWGEGADDPEQCPNGGWYDGEFSSEMHSDGRLSTPFTDGSNPQRGSESREPFCILRVADVDSDGGIKELLIMTGGMMFKSIFTSGVRHPDVFVTVGSDTGEGANAEIDIATNKASDNFGKVTACRIVRPAGVDPLHAPLAYPIGGRDYANPPSGYMWELRLAAHDTSMLAGPHPNEGFPYHGDLYNHFHPEKSEYNLVSGSHPPYVRRAERCTLEECYHSLLNGKTYKLYRRWSGAAIDFGSQAFVAESGCDQSEPNSYRPFPSSKYDSGTPPSGAYALYRKKGPWDDKSDPEAVRKPRQMTGNPAIDDPMGQGGCNENNFYQWNQPYDHYPNREDFVVVEYGFTAVVQVSSGNTGSLRLGTGCEFDHDDGRTVAEP